MICTESTSRQMPLASDEFMPLIRDKIIGFDAKSMVYRFMMLNGGRPVECSVSNAVFNYLEKIRYPAGNPDAQFLRWRETIEKAISDKFDAAGEPDMVSLKLFLKDIRTLLRKADKRPAS